MLIGYARVSDRSQHLEVQRAALLAASVEKLFEEKVSARMADNRPELQACIDFARKGDIVVVTRIDRWARSTRDLHNLLALLDDKGVGFRCLDQIIDTTTPTGKLTISILGAVAAFELDLRAERQAEGIAAAKERGAYRPRESKIDLDRVRDLAKRSMKPPEIAAIMGISRASVYRAMAAINPI